MCPQISHGIAVGIGGRPGERDRCAFQGGLVISGIDDRQMVVNDGNGHLIRDGSRAVIYCKRKGYAGICIYGRGDKRGRKRVIIQYGDGQRRIVCPQIGHEIAVAIGGNPRQSNCVAPSDSSVSSGRDDRQYVGIVCHVYVNCAGVPPHLKAAVRYDVYRVVWLGSTCLQYQVGAIDLKRVRVASRTYEVYRVLPIKERVLCSYATYDARDITHLN